MVVLISRHGSGLTSMNYCHSCVHRVYTRVSARLHSPVQLECSLAVNTLEAVLDGGAGTAQTFYTEALELLRLRMNST